MEWYRAESMSIARLPVEDLQLYVTENNGRWQWALDQPMASIHHRTRALRKGIASTREQAEADAEKMWAAFSARIAAPVSDTRPVKDETESCTREMVDGHSVDHVRSPA